MLRNISFFVVFLFCFTIVAQNKLEIGTVIQESKITKFNSQNLVLLDFWATWCGPCIPAGEQLEIYQEQLKNDIYMIGISDENEFKIKRFVDAQGMKMAIYQDFNLFNVKKYDVKYRPYSVILNNRGKVVWSGSPSKLYVDFIKRLSRGEKSREYQLSDLFKYNYNKLGDQFSEIDTLDIYSLETRKNIYESQFAKTDTRVYFEGDILSFFSSLYDLPKSNFQTDLDLKITFGSRKNIWDYDKQRIEDYIKNRHDIHLMTTTKRIKSKEVKVTDNSLLWDNTQIEWNADGSGSYIIGEDRIQADNMSIKQVFEVLSDVKNASFHYKGNDENLYDWNFHVTYDNLMIEELKYEFGLEIFESKTEEVEIISIKKSSL